MLLDGSLFNARAGTWTRIFWSWVRRVNHKTIAPRSRLYLMQPRFNHLQNPIAYLSRNRHDQVFLATTCDFASSIQLRPTIWFSSKIKGKAKNYTASRLHFRHNKFPWSLGRPFNAITAWRSEDTITSSTTTAWILPYVTAGFKQHS